MERWLGGNPLGVALRLIILSIVVGIVLSAMGITPQNVLYKLQLFIKRIYDLGFGAIDWVIGYFIIGAIVGIPIWLIVRLVSGLRGGDDNPRS